MSIGADNVINSVRDQIPDPVYSVSTSGGVAVGDPLPNIDGNLFRSQSLLRWINEGVKEVTKSAGYLIEDWLPVSVTVNQPYYTLDAKWVNITDVWFREYRLSYQDIGDQYGPFQLRGNQASMWGYYRKTDQLQVAILPIPATGYGDPVTAISAMATSDSIVNLTSTTSFNSYGWFKVDNEICAYQTVSGSTQLMQVSRGQCGTVSASHAVGASANHLGLVMRGVRLPTEVTTATGTSASLEVPLAFVNAIQLYVLWKCRTAENDYAEAAQQYKLFEAEMEKIKANPYWRPKQGMQIAPYGQQVAGGLAYGFVITR